MAAISSVSTLLVNGMPLLIETLANGYGLANDQLGLLGSAYLVGNCIVVCTSLFWIRRVDWRRTIVAGIIGGLVLLGVLIAAPSVTSFSICLFLFGGAMACCYAPVLAFWSDVANPARAVSIGILLQVAGAALFMFAVPKWFMPALGVRGLAGFLLVALALSMLLAPVIPRTGVQRFIRSEAQPSGAVRAAILPLVGLGIMGIYFTGFIGLWAFLGQIGTANGLSVDAASSALSISLLVGASAVVVTSMVGNRFGYLKPLILSLGVYALFLTLAASSQSKLSFTIGLILLNLAVNGALPYQLEIIAKSDRQGRYFVLLPAFQSAGAAAGPYLAGIMSIRGNYSGVYAMFVAAVAVSFVGYVSIAMRLGLVGTRRLRGSTIRHN
jgi:MFS family permease